MKIKKWLIKNLGLLSGKHIIITGATGGLGAILCESLVSVDAEITMACRNESVANKLKENIISKYPNAKINFLHLDLSNMEDVKNCIEKIKQYKKVDVFICNAGVYNVPVKKLDSGYNNIFQINFVAPYYMIKELYPTFKKNNTKCIAVGSVAHNYSKINTRDLDFSNTKKASKIYGNSKRFLMFSLYELFKDKNNPNLSIVHPGVTLTNMTNHYPKAINWLVKIGIKLLFPSPQKAVRNILYGISICTSYHIWIGPKLFNIWGKPTLKKLKTCTTDESKKIYEIAEKIYKAIKK